MADKYPVTVYGRTNSFIRAEDGATVGATLGVNLYDSAGNIVSTSFVDAAAAVAAHVALGDPHPQYLTVAEANALYPSVGASDPYPQYLTPAEAAALYPVTSVFTRTGAITAQMGDYTKAQVGLGNVDNTSDVNKPVSTAQQTALNLKANSDAPSFTTSVDLKNMGGTGAGIWYDGATTTRRAFVGINSGTDNVWRVFGVGAADNVLTANLTTGAVNIKGALTQNNQQVWYAGNFDPTTKLGVSAKAADAELLDGIDSTCFVSGDNATKTTSLGVGDMNVARPSGFYEYQPASTNAPTASWQWTLNFRHTNTTAPSAQYGWQLANAIGTNDFYVRGVTAGTWGAWDKIVTSAQVSDAASLATVVKRNPSGYIFSYYFNTDIPQSTGSTTSVYVEEGSDKYIRKHSLARFLQTDTAATNAKFADITASRGDGTGALFLNAASTAYLYFDGATHQLQGGPLNVANAITGTTVNATTLSAGTITVPGSSTTITNNSGMMVTGNWRFNGEVYDLSANAAAWIRKPRVFVQSADPGAQAADGDLWFW